MNKISSLLVTYCILLLFLKAVRAGIALLEWPDAGGNAATLLLTEEMLSIGSARVAPPDLRDAAVEVLTQFAAVLDSDNVTSITTLEGNTNCIFFNGIS